MEKHKEKIFFSLGFFVVLMFFFKSLYFIDPDFGWHYRMGELILKTGIPTKDPFSYTMPSFPYIDHEWLTNVFLFKFYNLIGKVGLSLVFLLPVLGALYLRIYKDFELNSLLKKRKAYFLREILFLIASTILMSFIGIRPQLITWLFLSFLFTFIFNPIFYQKYKFLLPFFFLVWTNLHGGFAVGIVVLFLFILLVSIRTRKISPSDLGVLFFSVFGTFINPYGERVWEEVWRTVSDTSLRWTIMEWIPSIFVFDLSFILFAVLSIVFSIKYRTRLKLEEKGLLAFFLLQGISSARHFPLYVFLALPFTLRSLYWFVGDIEKIKSGKTRFFFVQKYFFLLVLIILLLQLSIGAYEANYFKEGDFYPKGAVEYLKGSMPEGQIFADYGWGGYLIWKFPEKKVFIDGRMPSWRWDCVLPLESTSAMKDYNKLLTGKSPVNDVFDKYGIDTVLLPPQKNDLFTRIEKKFTKEEKFDFQEELLRLGWEKAYEDKVSIIFKR